MPHWADSVEVEEWGEQGPGHFAWGRWRSENAARKRLKADSRLTPLGANYMRIIVFEDGTAAIWILSTDEDDDEWDEDELPILEKRKP